MSGDLFNLLVRVLIFAGITVAVRKVLRLPLISASLAFWFGWAFLLLGGVIAEARLWIVIHTNFAPEMRQLFNGAFIGFLLVSFVPVRRRPPEQYTEFVLLAERVAGRVGRKALIALFLVGGVFFAQRVATVGFSADYLVDVRRVYNERNGGVLLQIGSHLMVLVTMLIILRGMVDAYRGIDIKALGLIILAAAPLSLANGSRIFLLAFVIAYVASLLLTRSSHRLASTLLTGKDYLKLGGTVSLLLLVFAVMGFLRGGYGEQLDIFYTVLIWPVSTLGAMDDWVSVALTSERTYGLNTFGWVVDALSRLHLIDISEATGVMQGVSDYFSDTNKAALVIPRSILPDLIFDFGPGGVFVGMAATAFLLELCSTRFAARGFFLHVLAVQSLLAGFMSIQTSVLTPPVVVSLFWGAVFSAATRVRRWPR